MVPRFLQRLADRADAAVHHVRRRNDIRPRRGLVQRLPDQHVGRRIVHYVPGRVDQAVMAVRGIGVERDVGQHADIEHRVL